MAANNEAMAVLSDEGGVFDILGGLYSDGKANIDLFLQAHAASSVRVDRKSSPPIFMERAVLSMGLTVQPQVIKSICGNKTFRGRGLLGRFLYAIPKSNIGHRNLNEGPMDSEIILQYRFAVKSILNHQPASADYKTQHVLLIEEEAYKKWWEYAKAVEIFMGEETGHLSHITDWAGKLPGAIARIAALLHIMRYCHQTPSEYPISAEDMMAAIKTGHVLKNHALVVFDLLHESEGMQLARNIFDWIKQCHSSYFTERECKRKFRRSKDIVPAAIVILEEHDILRERDPMTNDGRRSNIFDVNPLIFDA